MPLVIPIKSTAIYRDPIALNKSCCFSLEDLETEDKEKYHLKTVKQEAGKEYTLAQANLQNQMQHKEEGG